MKRKIFSKLLMGALLVASVSSFVSCKDYDDDINNLQDQINAAALKSDLSALQTTLASVQTTASGAASTAQSALEKAGVNATDIAAIKATATAQGDKIADAATQAAKGVTDAAAAQAAANAAQSTADAAKADAATAKAAAEAAQAAATAAKADADAAIAKAIADLKLDEKLAAKADAADLAALTTKVNGLATDLAKAQTDLTAAKALADANAAAITALETKAADFETRIAALEAKGSSQGTVDAMGWADAITAIDFVVDQFGVINNPPFLNFQFGKQLDNVFGNGKELHSYEATDKPETYSSKNDIKAENVYFVRVSPVNADLAAANLKLINSLGEDLGEFVDIVAEPYKELLTRAEETGLWKITVTLKEGADREKLQKATSAKLSRDKKRTISSAVYALAANNTDDVDARLAVTEYDLKAFTNEYAPTADLDFTVNGVAIANIYNRWNAVSSYVVAEDGSIERDSLYWELAWETAANAEKFGYSVPAVKAITNVAFDANGAAKNNYVADGADDRRAQPKLQVQPEEQIVVKFDIAQYPFVDRFYVQLEKDNAIESAPSEFESWKSYNPTGLSEMKKVSERLILTVPADAAEGDIIGFRVWAVNYDGTLVDPDGKAFYVQVGFVPNADDSDILSGTFTAREVGVAGDADAIVNGTANGVIIPFNFLEKYSLAKGTSANVAHGFVATLAVDPTKEQNANNITPAGTTVSVYYLKSDKADSKKKAQLATKVEDVKFIALSIQNPERIIDGATIETDPLQFIDVDKHNKTIGYLSFLLKKGDIVPNATTNTNDNKIEWKSGQNGTFYPQIASATWNAPFLSPADDELIDLTTYATGLDTYANLAIYKWTISKIANNTTTEADFVQPSLNFTAQNITSTRTADVSTSQSTGGTATTFNLNVTPTMVKYAKSVTITISDYAGTAGLSRTSLTTTPTTGDPHIYQTLTLNFADVWNFQTYENSLKYVDGTVGAAVSAAKTNDQTFYVQNSSLGNGLNVAWTAATNDGGTPAKITAVAVKNYPAGTGESLATIHAASENSKYELFAGSTGAAGFAWNAADYVKFAEYDFNGDKTIGTNDYAYYVKSENGAVNEYITPATLPTVGNMATILGANFTFTPTVGAPTLMTKINQTLVIKVVDAFGLEHDFSIPFELIP